ncbi:MAG: hypothetical protein ABWY00_18645 [Dongiaceae bacterium]
MLCHALVLLSLAGCDSLDFPWSDQEPIPTQQATGPMPTVTRGKTGNTPVTVKPKVTKPKAAKKPADTSGSTPLQAGPETAPNEGVPLVTPGSADTAGQPTPDQPGTEQPNAGQPNDMLGQDESGIRAMFGEPASTRTDGSSTVWSYHKEGCALDLFLFYDVKTGARRVLSYEIKPDATDSNAIQVCYNKFRNV